MNDHLSEPFRSLLNNLAARGPNPCLPIMADRTKHPAWHGPFVVNDYIGLPGDRLCFQAIENTEGICCAGRETRELAENDCDGLNAAFQLGCFVADARARRTHLTIEHAIEILNRSERGRVVGRQLYDFLADRACSLDMDGKVAVLALIEESFVNRPGSVFGALGDAFAEHPHNLDSPRSECAT